MLSLLIRLRDGNGLFILMNVRFVFCSCRHPRSGAGPSRLTVPGGWPATRLLAKARATAFLCRHPDSL